MGYRLGVRLLKTVLVAILIVLCFIVVMSVDFGKADGEGGVTTLTTR